LRNTHFLIINELIKYIKYLILELPLLLLSMQMKSKRKMYLDNASTTPLDPRVLRAMLPYLKEKFGNPGSIHSYGVEAEDAVTNARKSIAKNISALPDEIIFTSGGTESNNAAILGLIGGIESASKYDLDNLHIISSVIEHSSVIEPIKFLQKKGVSVSFIPVDSKGMVNLPELKKSLKPTTVLVSIALANNEIGTIQPIREIAKIIRQSEKIIKYDIGHRPTFHTDASQAVLYQDLNVLKLGIDLLTIDGHKIYGPKGVGVLYLRRGVKIAPLIHGGGQESGLRGGTENVPSIVGLSKALQIAVTEREREVPRLSLFRDLIIDRTLNIFPKSVLNGDKVNRLPNNINLSIPRVDTEFLTLQFDNKGIAVSTKSACLRDDDYSYVVRSLGGGKRRSKKTLRISLGRYTTTREVMRLINTMEILSKFNR